MSNELRPSGSDAPGTTERRGDLVTVDDRPVVEDPGHPEHLPRLTDVDDATADRAARKVATLFTLSPIMAVAFVVVYFAVPKDWTVDFGLLNANAQHVLLGLTFGLALLFIGMGAVRGPGS